MEDANLQRLTDIMDELREKCPWDRKQTIHSLRQQTIEELYELTDAIDADDYESIKEELGDLLLHIVFYTKIAEEQNHFTLRDVVDTISEKLIKRHPHIYGDVKADNAEEVKRNWEKLKLADGKNSVLGGIPNSLPALVKSMRLQGKAAQAGFEWERQEDVWDKVMEEKEELEKAMSSGDNNESTREAGDLLFSVVNYIRFLNIDADYALELTNKKFIDRFKKMESIATETGKNLIDMSLQEMDEIWNQIKRTP
ncbi:MAG: nucleoside triphosphate pyrophosphohydrolase [Chitinophagaceae bacterium]|nr:nucleoside triphosphate pyrophosphohydrolase [Chitinophagaceae bacterium]